MSLTPKFSVSLSQSQIYIHLFWEWHSVYEKKSIMPMAMANFTLFIEAGAALYIYFTSTLVCVPDTIMTINMGPRHNTVQQNMEQIVNNLSSCYTCRISMCCTSYIYNTWINYVNKSSSSCKYWVNYLVLGTQYNRNSGYNKLSSSAPALLCSNL